MSMISFSFFFFMVLIKQLVWFSWIPLESVQRNECVLVSVTHTPTMNRTETSTKLINFSTSSYTFKPDSILLEDILVSLSLQWFLLQALQQWDIQNTNWTTARFKWGLKVSGSSNQLLQENLWPPLISTYIYSVARPDASSVIFLANTLSDDTLSSLIEVLLS